MKGLIEQTVKLNKLIQWIMYDVQLDTEAAMETRQVAAIKTLLAEAESRLTEVRDLLHTR